MSNTPSDSSNKFNWMTVFGPVLFLAAVGAVIWRADSKHSEPGAIVDSRFDDSQGYRDFHNAIYFPGRAFVSGVNPYSKEYSEYHPDKLGFPLFAPSSLLIHSPLAFLNLQTAEIVYLIINFCLLIFICWFSVRKSTIPYSLGVVFTLAAFVVICRPGVLNFLGLQMTLLLVVGTLMALEYSESSPVLSGLGLLLACCKPTYAIPLAVMMLARRNLSAAAIGIFFCAIANCAVVGIISSQLNEQANGKSGVEAFIDQGLDTYVRSTKNALEVPEVTTSWSRIDLYSVVARWYDVSDVEKLNFIVPACVLLWGAFFVLIERHHEQRVGVNSRTGLLTLLIVLSCIYHQPYDGLLLWIPLSALFFGSIKFDEGLGATSKFLLIFLLMIPMLNFLSTKMVLDRLDLEKPFVAEVVASEPATGLSVEVGEVDEAEEEAKLTGPEIWNRVIAYWPWKLTVTLNGIAIILAAFIVSMSILIPRRNQ